MTFVYHLNGVVPVLVEIFIDRQTNEPLIDSVSIAGVELDDLTTVGELRDGDWVALETILSERLAALAPTLPAAETRRQRATWRAPALN